MNSANLTRLAIAAVLLSVVFATRPLAARDADASSPWSGHWTIIHLDPSLPLGSMVIGAETRTGFPITIRHVQDHVFCPGQPVVAYGTGHLSDATHMWADFSFNCYKTGKEGKMRLYFQLGLGNPHGILAIAEMPGTGRVWTRPI
jgi:hypothetical protein